MINVLKLNAISKLAETTLGKNYTVTDNCANPEAVILRSFVMHDWAVPSSLLCVARAGAGVNNIPYDDYAKQGVVVFNTPGANANAVKELVIAALIMTSRNIISGSKWANTLVGDDVKKQVEKGKSQFAGTEILGKTIGILGLGAIGRKVAVAANALGMNVVGFDMYLSDEAKALDFVKIADSMDEVYALADFITIHIPYSKDTHHFINSSTIAKMKDGVIIINAARGELVSVDDVKEAIANKKVRSFYTDFPDTNALNSDGIVITPHLGASSAEAEENCAQMAAKEIKLFVEEGTIKNAVNMPPLALAKTKAHRASVIYCGNVSIPATATVTNKNGVSYAIIDSDRDIDINALSSTQGVIKARKVF